MALVKATPRVKARPNSAIRNCLARNRPFQSTQAREAWSRPAANAANTRGGKAGFMSSRREKNFARIENAARIEGGFEALH